ncbi:hypothetical protein FRACYDRAFT_262438 [Fragilariopsis cylindrus CCMP1102]|uniref:EF-hand domain-containing protein n=1 Tax=Fragilariopsis cylindrus CCMP1102 TaxID=635003 RepID=A0A1E7F7W1_9STRA|nr:hypothetical protein FRACYDRAFT_262438 [Fragilariopsis cylindrus CCMP1102]|eukprot:OEU13943.1 hypothetical protein FRACYDRAFT_262438 [Fragilariopsis cylindrus CCMP1102]
MCCYQCYCTTAQPSHRYFVDMLFCQAQESSQNNNNNNNNNNNDCYDDMYTSDENGDGKIDSEEYVEFSRRRLQSSLITMYYDDRDDDEYVQDELDLLLSSDYESFTQLPSVLQQNWFILACLCSRYQFNNNVDDDDNNNIDNGFCCVGDNAHLYVTTAADGGIETVTNDKELMYINLVCDFTQRAVDDVISNTITIEEPSSTPSIITNSPTTSSPTKSPTLSPTTSSPTKSPTLSPTSSSPTKSPTLSPTRNPQTIAPTPSPTPTSTGSRPSIEPTTIETNTTTMPTTIESNKTTMPTTTVMPTIAPTIFPVPSLLQPPSPSQSSSSPSSSTTLFELSIGIIVVIIAGGLLLIMILIQALVLITTRDYRRSRKYPADLDNDDANDNKEDDPETGLPLPSSKSSGKKKESTTNEEEDIGTVVTTPSTINTGLLTAEEEAGTPPHSTSSSSSIVQQSNLGQQQQQQNEINQQQVEVEVEMEMEMEVEMNDQQSDNNILVTNSIPYIPHADTNTSIISDDAKSTGCVSHESDAGWSEAYTSSVESVSDDDDEISFKSNHNDHDLSEGPVPAITATISTDEEGDNNNLGLSSIIATTAMDNTENTTPPDESITATTTTAIPKSRLDCWKINNNNVRSPEEFRAEVYALIERVIPEEIDQADDMIAQFTDREDELLQTLVAMGKRASAQHQLQQQE